MTDKHTIRETLAVVKSMEQRLAAMIIATKIRIDDEHEVDGYNVSSKEIQEQRQALETASGSNAQTVYGLANVFELTPLERDALLLAFAPELEPQSRLGFSQVSTLMAPEGRPTLGMIAYLLSNNNDEKIAVRKALSKTGRLRRYRLIEVIEHPGWVEADALVLIHRDLKELLLCIPNILCGKIYEGIPSEIDVQLNCSIAVTPDQGDRIIISGSQKVERSTTAAAFAAQHSLPIYLTEVVPEQNIHAQLEQVAVAIRDGILKGAVPAVEIGGIGDTDQEQLLNLILANDTMPLNSLIVMLPHELSGTIRNKTPNVFSLSAGAADYPDIYKRWQLGLERCGCCCNEDTISSLAGSYRLEPWCVEEVARTALNAIDKPQVPLQHLVAAAKQLAGKKPVSYARKVEPRYTLDDMVLPKVVKDHIGMLIGFASQRERLLYQYGFAKKYTLGHGLVALLSGESGTGKTMAAEVLANALHRDLYIVDLSRLVSKWVGETEKHIDQIFTEAEQVQGVLLFDEADALFANRSGDVNSSNDRYANMEVGYLLQRIEAFRGVAVLTTNLTQNIDDAFLRRFHFRIDVPKPSPDLSAQIWEKMLLNTGCDFKQLDLLYLAKRFELTGGNIRNALMKATFLADRDGASVNQDHLVEAATLESVELGRLV